VLLGGIDEVDAESVDRGDGAVVELIAEAGAHAGGDDGGDELSLVDLSSVRA
jgi:hypothetical protein